MVIKFDSLVLRHPDLFNCIREKIRVPGNEIINMASWTEQAWQKEHQWVLISTSELSLRPTAPAHQLFSSCKFCLFLTFCCSYIISNNVRNSHISPFNINLAVVKVDHQTIKFSYLPNFQLYNKDYNTPAHHFFPQPDGPKKVPWCSEEAGSSSDWRLQQQLGMETTSIAKQGRGNSAHLRY